MSAKKSSSRKFKVRGLITEESSGQACPGLLIEAWDKDFLFNDLLGKAISNAEGEFKIEFNLDDFSDKQGKHIKDAKLDIYFLIFCDTVLVKDTRHSVVWNAGTKTKVKIEVSVPSGKSCPCPAETVPCNKRNVYLQIEKIVGYNPVEPSTEEHGAYRRDCFRGTGHEDGFIPDEEVDLRVLDAIIYREYTDETYTTPVPDKIVLNDILEPPEGERVPGVVIYTEPGERLYVHVRNQDSFPHSLHVHGLAYGINSDGAFPVGVNALDERRSDQICRGETWIYDFDVRDDMVGCWPFHDHYREVMSYVNRGLFGGIVVRDRKKPRPDLEVPFFLHRLIGERQGAAFDSGTLQIADGFNYTFPSIGTFNYNCRFHSMFGTIEVVAAAPMDVNVQIIDGPASYVPDTVQVGPGGTVHWINNGSQEHTVTESNGAGALESFCINGRSFVGNTPRIVGNTGERIRWYVFNLDFGTMWHNFHTHAQRWRWGDEMVDTRSIGPAESFCVDTIVPEVLLPFCKEENDCEEEDYEDDNETDDHEDEDDNDSDDDDKKYKQSAKKRKSGSKLKKYQAAKCRDVDLCAEYPIHCHVEPHMMQGMICTLMAKQTVSLTEAQILQLGIELPEECPEHGCNEVDLGRCSASQGGFWEILPDSEVYAVHGAVLHTGKVLLYSGLAEKYTLPADYPLESRLFDPVTNTQTTQTVGENLFCSGHTFLPDGRLLVSGGDRPTQIAPRIDSTHIFDPATSSWTKLPNDMSDIRWYPTVIPLPDGRAITVSGAGGSNTMEVFDPATNVWAQMPGSIKNFNGLYPSIHHLPNGEMFWTRTSFSTQSGTSCAKFQFSGLNDGFWVDMSTQEFTDRREGMSVLMIDASVSPAISKVYVVGGGVSGASKNPQSMEILDVSSTAPAPVWSRASDMNFPRTNVNAVLLPTGNILVVGGQRNGKWAIDPNPVLEAEIYDPASDSWIIAATMTYPKQYHSVVMLLPDGRVLAAGGIDPSLATTTERDQRHMEMFSPPYLDGSPRPAIGAVATEVTFGVAIAIPSLDAGTITSVCMIRPNSVTHHTDAGHRYIKLGIDSIGGGNVNVTLPADGNIAPPGYYMLFIVNNVGIPSEATWIRIS